jgi:hypothetical protein
MGRHKKIKTVQVEEKTEAQMTTTDVLEVALTELDLARLELSQVQRQIEEKKLEMERFGQTAPVKTSGLRDVTPEEQVIMDRHAERSVKSRELKIKMERQMEIDSEEITGRFMNRRAPGQPAKLTYQKYAHDPVKWWNLEDGKIYTIPRGFADQINNHYHTPVFTQKQGIMDPNRPESAIHEIDTSNKKYAFVPVSF